MASLGAYEIDHQDSIRAAFAQIAQPRAQCFMGWVFGIGCQRLPVAEADDEAVRDLRRLALVIGVCPVIEAQNALQ